MSHTDSGLTLEIEDDGVGLASDNSFSGVGRTSMTERATELGGWCTNEHSPTGGTRVKAWLPILIEGSAADA
jgi:two-component system, NarL family, sensor kinase